MSGAAGGHAGSAAAGRGEAWQVEERRGLAAFDALAPEWRELCRQGSPEAPFHFPAWVRAHVEAFEDPRKLIVLAARTEGRLGAVLPLIRERVWFRGLPLRRLRAAAGVHSLRFDVVAAAGESGRQAVQAIAAHLRTRGGWDLIELRDVAEGGQAQMLIADAAAHGLPVGRWESMRTPYIDLIAGVDSKGAPLPPGMQGTTGEFRRELRRTRRKLEAQTEPAGVLQLVRAVVDTPAHREASLTRFYTIEAAGWKGRNGSAIACLPAARRFYDTAAADMAAEGKLILHSLELNGTSIAMSYSLIHRDCYYVIKWGYDEAYAKYGAGHLLIEAILHDCAQPEAGPALRRFDINGPDAEYKRKWTETRLPHAYLYVFRRGPAGRLLYALKFTWTERLRAWTERLRQPRPESGRGGAADPGAQ